MRVFEAPLLWVPLRRFVSSAGGEAPFVAAEEAGGRNDPRPDIMDVNPFKDTEMRMLLTFRNPVLEHHYRYFRMHKREMVTFTGCFLRCVNKFFTSSSRSF